MHNGRVLKHGTPQQIENDAEVAGDLHGRRPAPMSWFSRRRVEGGPGPILRVDRLNVHYGRAHAVQDVSLTLDRGILAVVGRNGMGKTTLCNAITGLVAASGSIKLAGTETGRPGAACDHRPRRRLRAAGPPRLAVAHGRRAPAARRTQRPSRRLDDRAHLRSLPAARRAARQRRRPALRRRAADAGDRPRAAVQSAPAGDGRADRGPGAGDRRAGRRDAEVAGRRCACRSCWSSRISAWRSTSPTPSP